MKYNIIGDIHSRTNWRKLVDPFMINIFVGDYFSPYYPYSFEDQKREFLDIVLFARQFPTKTILLIGNHDEDHWHLREQYSRFDDENVEEITRLFEENKDLFQIAYSIENKVLVTHAGVSLVWYERQKNHILFSSIIDCNHDEPNTYLDLYSNEQIPNPRSFGKFSLVSSPLEAYELYNKVHYPDSIIKLEPRDGYYLLWKNKYWRYNANIKDYEEFEITPNELSEFINNLWKSGKYNAFNFFNNSGPTDYYGNDERHGPLWIRPEALTYCNIFDNTNYWQVVGHTMHHDILISYKDKLAFVDVLGHNTQSLIYDSNLESFEINNVETNV